MLAVPDHPNNNHIFKHLVRKNGREYIRQKVKAAIAQTQKEKMKKRYAIGAIKYTEVLDIISDVMVILNDDCHKTSLKKSITSIWGTANQRSNKVQELMEKYDSEYGDKTESEIFPWIKEIEDRKKELQQQNISFDQRLLKYKNLNTAFACSNTNCTFTHSSKYSTKAKNHEEKQCPFFKPYGCVPMLPVSLKNLPDELIQIAGHDDYTRSRVTLNDRFFWWDEKSGDSNNIKSFEATGIIKQDLGNGLVLALCHLAGGKNKDRCFYYEVLDIGKLRFRDTTRIWRLKGESKMYKKRFESLLKASNTKCKIKEIKFDQTNGTLTKLRCSARQMKIQQINDGAYKDHGPQRMQHLKQLRLIKNKEKRKKKNAAAAKEKQTIMNDIKKLKKHSVLAIITKTIDALTDEKDIDEMEQNVESMDYDMDNLKRMVMQDLIELCESIIDSHNGQITKAFDNACDEVFAENEDIEM